ncbi:arginine--tRNA ligase [Paenibacillus sp. 598K]|uniref:arginine--tRNA ligase n=1 Tax=Paenibacillus sp. 598K TaxID=1117987 RepID=UPI000FF9A383|nr:arginine--tRNA ligase [Paenibacillus sp. 598K]GBF77813.1 arginine--tRNA ligase [Paenibacillus sp. 598K]
MSQLNVLDKMNAKIREAIADAVVAAGLVGREELPVFALEVPRDKAHGDLATNAAMQLTKLAKKNPRQIAEAILTHLDKEAASIESADIAGPGFINFRLDKRFLHEIVPAVLAAGSDYGRASVGNGQRVQVEFVSANPTGSLHLGHARGAAVGDALCNLLDYAGYEVTREYYINDAGKQIENLAYSIEARYRQELGEAAELPEDGYHGEDIIGFARQLREEQGDELMALPQEERFALLRSFGLERELDKIRRDLGRFRVPFDVWFHETSLYQNGQIDEVLAKLRASGHVYEEEGATWLETVSLGDDKNRVLVKNDGSYTYLTPDIAYHRDKYERGYDKIINIWGADHHGYIPRVKAAMAALGYDPDKLIVLIAQMVSLFQDGEKVKMSKRTGKAVTMEDLMEEVGVDAVRYFFTMRSMDSHLDFDMDLAVSTSNENPVFYVQYAHARVCSVFRQAEEQGIATDGLAQADLSQLTSEAEYDLLRKLGELPQEVAESADNFAPHRLVRYVYELASLFHSYYRAERFITEDQQQTTARLALLAAVRTTIFNVLRLIGVHAPERM